MRDRGGMHYEAANKPQCEACHGIQDNTVVRTIGLQKKFGHGRSTKYALNGVSFELRQGEILGIIGESGSGKTTLLKLLAGLIKPDFGEIYLEKRALHTYKKELYKVMQMIFQDAKASFNPKKTIGAALNETKSHLCTDSAKNCDLLDMVGLDADYEFKYPHQLSGGECQRAAIARAFCVMPKLLLCDEITSALDVIVQKDIIKLLIHLSKIHEVSAIFVTHDLPLASGFCDRLLIMKDGRIVENGSTSDIIHFPKAEYTRELLSHVL